jgi:hypothetical protein
VKEHNLDVPLGISAALDLAINALTACLKAMSRFVNNFTIADLMIF